MKPTISRALRPNFGLSLVELMVGITVGLFILAGATLIAGQQISENRKLLLETQVQQDLRMAADIIIRNLRQSSYWKDADSSVWPANSPPTNPFQSALTPGKGMQSISFNIDPSPSALTPTNSNLGFQVNANGELQMQMGTAGWQSLTDANTVSVNSFQVDITPSTMTIPCQLACPAPSGGNSCWPKITINDVTIRLSGTARHDPTGSVQRSIQADVRLRNDAVVGQCPT